jgi:hypothetical protein
MLLRRQRDTERDISVTQFSDADLEQNDIVMLAGKTLHHIV